jgi:hypothetical protein
VQSKFPCLRLHSGRPCCSSQPSSPLATPAAGEILAQLQLSRHHHGRHADGSALVSEKITLAFDGSGTAFTAPSPSNIPDPTAPTTTLFIDVTSVTDENGNKLKYDSSNRRRYRDLKIYIPKPSTPRASSTSITRVRNGIALFRRYDEFYWNVTGNDWPVPIDHASASVHAPRNGASGLRARKPLPAPTAQPSAMQLRRWKAQTLSSKPPTRLPMRGGLTIDIYVAKGILKAPGRLQNCSGFSAAIPPRSCRWSRLP